LFCRKHSKIYELFINPLPDLYDFFFILKMKKRARRKTAGFREKEMKEMKDLTIPFEAVSEETKPETAAVKNNRKGWLTALVFSSASGVAVGLSGLIISALNFFGMIEKTSVVSHVGTLLIVIAFPLVMFSAHAMDKIAEIDKKEKRKKIEEQQRQESYSPEKWKE